MDDIKPRRLPMVPGPPDPQKLPISAAVQVNERQTAERPPLFQIGPVGNLAKAIAEVMSKVGTIPKRGLNKFHNYHYVLMEDVLNAVTPLMGQAGLAIIQNEIKINQIENNRVAVVYEFHLIHESGETWPPMRGTGMAMARDSKGNIDDKAINKCHTAARKYFVSSLFQIPAGDFPDVDSDEDVNANQRKERGPVPGPYPAQTSQPTAGLGRSEGQGFGPGKIEAIPHKLMLGPGHDADDYASAYIRAIGAAQSQEEIEQWDKLNDSILQKMSDTRSELYDRIRVAVERRLSDLVKTTPDGMPDPKVDPQDSMNWIAAQLQAMSTYEAAEAFWNEMVAPLEKQFDIVDWSMLLDEFTRAEHRLNPPAPEPEAA
jgi:hypothetical protein